MLGLGGTKPGGRVSIIGSEPDLMRHEIGSALPQPAAMGGGTPFTRPTLLAGVPLR